MRSLQKEKYDTLRIVSVEINFNKVTEFFTSFFPFLKYTAIGKCLNLKYVCTLNRKKRMSRTQVTLTSRSFTMKCRQKCYIGEVFPSKDEDLENARLFSTLTDCVDNHSPPGEHYAFVIDFYRLQGSRLINPFGNYAT